jgi:acetyl-CoA carboxylase biotin carboxyl carrier protein
MNPAERIARLAALLEGTGIVLLELTGPDEVIRLRRDAVSHEAAASNLAAVDGARPVIRAPSVGVFRERHPTNDTPLIAPGHTVEPGEVIALIQVGMLLLHVLAPTGGVVTDVLAADGDVVGYGAPLFKMTEARP